MEATEYIRVVGLRKGKLKAVEFRLRPGERGLSLFSRVERPGPTEIVAAVRAAGKQGDLAATVIPSGVFREIGLKMVSTPGGTPVSEVNRLHAEARLPVWRSFLMRMLGQSVDLYFNERFSERLVAAAQVLERGE